jgi:hypothetical protein
VNRISEILKIAQELDDQGFHKEASGLDEIACSFLKTASGRTTLRKILGACPANVKESIDDWILWIKSPEMLNGIPMGPNLEPIEDPFGIEKIMDTEILVNEDPFSGLTTNQVQDIGGAVPGANSSVIVLPHKVMKQLIRGEEQAITILKHELRHVLQHMMPKFQSNSKSGIVYFNVQQYLIREYLKRNPEFAEALLEAKKTLQVNAEEILKDGSTDLFIELLEKAQSNKFLKNLMTPLRETKDYSEKAVKNLIRMTLSSLVFRSRMIVWAEVNRDYVADELDDDLKKAFDFLKPFRKDIVDGKEELERDARKFMTSPRKEN